MALSTRYFLTLAVLVQLTTQNTNLSSVCSPAEIQFQRKYCKGSVNSSVIANEPDSIKVVKICSDFVEEYEEIFEYQEILKCKESENCLSAKQSMLRVCIDRLKSILPPEFNDSIPEQPKLAEIDDNICSSVEIQFQHKYCKGSVNSSVIANEPDSIKVVKICSDFVEEYEEIFEYQEILKCKESENCLSAKQSMLRVCIDRLKSILPPEFNDSISEEPKLAEIDVNICSPVEIQFQHKYCKGSVNSSVIANEPDSIKVVKICSDFVEEYEEIFEYQEILKCKESENCLSAKQSMLRVCIDRLKSILPPEFNDSISEEPKLAETDVNICSPVEIQFQHKYCKGSVNSSVIANEPDSIKIDDMCSVLIEEYKEISEYLEILNCKDSWDCLSDKHLTITLCLNHLQSILPPEFNDSMSREQLLIECKAIKQRLNPILYVILGIIFAVGIMTNGLLTIIFVRHKAARNDVMLINLAVTDILSLMFNTILFTVQKSVYCTNYYAVFESSSHLLIFVNQYSLLMISIQRFRAVSNRTEMRKQIIVPNWVKIACLWILGSLYGTLHYIFGYISNNYFYNVRLIIIILYLSTVIKGVIPVILITVFCILASNRLKKLANNFPGERDHHLQRINDRYLASKALIALVISFVISYVPYNTTVFLVLNYYPNQENLTIKVVADAGTWYWVFIFTIPAMLLNSALNPLVLYFLSSKFRRYFKSYLCCRTHDLD